MQVVSENSKLDAAWSAFDIARIRLEALYHDATLAPEPHALRIQRCEAAIEVARLWNKWRDIFLSNDRGPDDSAQTNYSG